ncbi:MAG: Gfo/Idh/MocA family oxidoreductase [Acidobacteria bacterium]|nr:Gfo/Idh/MocA family oxidoreductase [Acidobacteriota bacterium]
MERRDFLHLAIATAVAQQGRALFAARPQQTGPAGANDRIRAAIIGCGNRGRAVMREWIEHPDTTFVAACDVAKDRTDATVEELTTAGHKPQGYEDYRRILERNDVDAVLIGTPDHWHAPMVIEAMAAGKDVYVEKPVSNQIEPAVRMLRAARASKRVVQVGQQQRSWTHFQDAADRFHKQAIGSVIRHVVMAPPGGGGGGGGAAPAPLASEMPAEAIPAGFNWDLFQGPAERRPFLAARRGWRGWWAYGGGNLSDWGVHLTDVMSWFMQADSQVPILTSASAQYVGTRRDPERTPNTYAATWQFQNFVATLSNAMMPGVEHPEEKYGNWFFGNGGTMVVNRLGWEIFPAGGGRGGGRGGARGGGAAQPPAAPPVAAARFRDPNGRSEARGTEFAFATRRHVRNFLDAVKSRGRTNCDIEAGFYAALPCLLANVAIREERTVRWDGDKLAVV